MNLRKICPLLLCFLSLSIGRVSFGAPADVDKAVESIVKETNDFNEGSEVLLITRRPHPALAPLSADDAPRVLERMMGQLTGDPVRDAYVRFHLLPFVLKGTEANPKGLFKILGNLLKQTPAEYKFDVKLMHRWEPKDLGERYAALLQQTRIVTGFPPFQREVGPPESFEFMAPDQRKKAESAWEEAKKLQSQVKFVTDQAAAAHNSRGWWMQWLLRQTRGEMMLGMLMSGEPQALEYVAGQIVQNAVKNPTAACDAASFLNIALADGWLGQYEAAKLKQVAKQLKQAASQGVPGAQPNTAAAYGWQDKGGRLRSLPETLFTSIQLMESGKVPQRAKGGFIDPTRVVAPPSTQPLTLTADDITLEHIDDAIARALNALDKLPPPRAVLTYLSFDAVGLPHYPPDLMMPGQWALAAQASLGAGESFQNPAMLRRILWVLSADSASTYDRAMRLQVLSMLPLKEWAPWMKRDVEMLIASITQKGNFSPIFTAVNPDGFSDNASGQYGVLGLWAAARAGYEISPKVWEVVDRYWRQAQWPGSSDKSGGWAVNSAGSLKETDNANDFRNQVSAPMTAAGVLTLCLTERFLYGPKRLDVGQGFSSDLSKGLAWLDENFDLNNLGGDDDFYYYTWTIQNVGQATGYRTLNGIDWHRAATARLLNDQGPDGLWKGPKGPVVSTSFALLYLQRARGPLAICKLRFDPSAVADAKPVRRKPRKNEKADSIAAWNNRPHDLVNYTDYLTDQLEVPTNWQIADLDQPVHELIESPILYLATDKPVTLGEAQIDRLRDYIEAGGLLLAAPEGRQMPPVVAGFESLGSKLFPDRQFATIEKSHPFFSLFRATKLPITVKMLANEIRPLMVIVERDLSRELQANQHKSRDSFDLLANIYLYATGRQPKRPRVSTNYIIDRQKQTNRSLLIARVKYDGAFDPEPLAGPQLRALLRNETAIDAKVEPRTAAAVEGAGLALLTIGETARPSDAELATLRAWAESGGTIWIDFAGGLNVDPMLVDVIKGLGMKPSDFKPLRSFPPAIAIATQPATQSTTQPATKPSTQATTAQAPELPFMPVDRDFNTSPEHGRPTRWLYAAVRGRPAVFICAGDLMSGMAGVNHWRIAGPTPRTAREVLLRTALWLSPPPKPKPPATTQATTGPATAPATKPATTQPAVAR